MELTLWASFRLHKPPSTGSLPISELLRSRCGNIPATPITFTIGRTGRSLSRAFSGSEFYVQSNKASASPPYLTRKQQITPNIVSATRKAGMYGLDPPPSELYLRRALRRSSHFALRGTAGPLSRCARELSFHRACHAAMLALVGTRGSRPACLLLALGPRELNCSRRVVLFPRARGNCDRHDPQFLATTIDSSSFYFVAFSSGSPHSYLPIAIFHQCCQRPLRDRYVRCNALRDRLQDRDFMRYE